MFMGNHSYPVTIGLIKAFKLIIYHVVLPRAKDSDQFISWKCNGLTLRDQNLGSSEAVVLLNSRLSFEKMKT